MIQLTSLYHMAETANWPAIKRDGLHSASTLLDLAGILGILSTWEHGRTVCYNTLMKTNTIAPDYKG